MADKAVIDRDCSEVDDNGVASVHEDRQSSDSRE
jgi:hypothetical protein